MRRHPLHSICLCAVLGLAACGEDPSAVNGTADADRVDSASDGTFDTALGDVPGGGDVAEDAAGDPPGDGAAADDLVDTAADLTEDAPTTDGVADDGAGDATVDVIQEEVSPDVPGDDAADAAADDGDGGSCPAESAPPGPGDCPQVCTGGCTEDNTCVIDCENNDCDGDTHDCPAGYACLVRCIGVDHCDEGTVNCPVDYDCTLVCEGDDACGNPFNLNCDQEGNGSCHIECGTHPNSCVSGTNVNCGAGSCSASCTGEAAPGEMAGCDGACACSECP